jgi:hypothetical protein
MVPALSKGTDKGVYWCSLCRALVRHALGKEGALPSAPEALGKETDKEAH